MATPTPKTGAKPKASIRAANGAKKAGRPTTYSTKVGEKFAR